MSEGSRPVSADSAIAELVRRLQSGARPALARAISIVENQVPGFRDLLHALHPDAGRAQRIGITGPPGAGKSTLVNALITRYRAAGLTVAVIAVDPTSPFTGGALLGDRIRMNEISMDAGVFVRSMATRGSVGGLALTTEEVADVLDAAGYDRILIETVGVGQTELDIAAAADTTVVVLVPESGDGIQAMKAGLMEVSDLFVINKSDRPGADRMARDISMMLHLRAGRLMRNVPAHHGVDMRRAARSSKGEADSARPSARPARVEAATAAAQAWEIPVLETVADTGEGVAPVIEALDRHFEWLQESGEREQRRQARVLERVREEVERTVRRRIWQEKGGDALLAQAADALARRAQSPYEVASAIIRATIG